MGSIRSNASVEYGGGSSVAWIRVRPFSSAATGGPTVCTPSTPATAAETRSTSSARSTMMSVGAPEPAGKLLASSSWPSIDSTFSR